MSTVTPAKLVSGTTATAMGHNGNVQAWSAAAGASMINAPNIRQEGLDHNNILDNSVEATDRAGGARFFESSTASGAIAAPGGVTMGGNPVVISGIVVSAGDTVIVRCACRAMGPAGTYVTLQLEASTAGYVAVATTERPVSATAANLMDVDYVVTHKHAGGAGTWAYRLVVASVTAGTVSIDNAVLYAEVIAR